ncbi:MAG: hypothetical protein NTZ18_00235 [Candidatus Komeilibacteria bacterium]|nr:hypothetical protein [Candidatus Komeilibacteria bacterium]
MKKYLTRTNLLSFALFALLAIPAGLAHGAVSLGLEAAASTGLGTRDLKDTIVQVLNVILGFLGIIAVIIILLGGFKWMTAGGGDDKIAEAKKLISAGIVGLVVILAAYAIAIYVVNTISSATTDTGAGGR